MSVPNAPVRPTPRDINPPDTVCLQIEVPNDRQWIAAFYDAVEQLSYWYAWDRDDAHTGREIAARWWKVFLSIRKCRAEQPKDGCCDGSEETLIRQNPDNPCLLESSSDGIHWCTLFDQSLCVPANGQPGSGARQPADGGGEECYHADFPSTMQWNLPTIVSEGDTIEVKNTDGQATDAPNHVWYCPNGQLFFAGKCISIPFTQGGDPAAAANHMTIVCQIAGVWYPTESPITVPAGVSNAPVVFQVNDGVLSDNSGGYSFDVCVTNNAVPDWCFIMDFELDDFAWVPNVDGYTQGLYTPGTGWLPVSGVETSGGQHRQIVNLTKHIPSCTIKTVDMTFDLHKGAYFITTTPAYAVYLGSTPVINVHNDMAVNGDAQHATWIGSEAGVTDLLILLQVAATAAYGGSGRIARLKLTGSGTNPFGADNC